MTSEPLPEAIALPDAPTDGITALSYLPCSGSNNYNNNNNNTNHNKSLLASTSFDGSVRIHDTLARKVVLSQTMESGPLLSLATPASAANNNNNNVLVTGGADGTIRMLDIEANAYQVIGRHVSKDNNDPKLLGVSCLGTLSSSAGGSSDDTTNTNTTNNAGPLLMASAGWNGQFHVWDVRTSSTSTSTAAATIALPNHAKAFAMDVDPVNPYRCVLATAGRRIVVVDVRYQGGVVSDTSSSSSSRCCWDATIALDREASLKFQCRTVRYFPDGNAIALGSTEGRVAIEYFDDLNLPSKKKYAFKCHRQDTTVYPVNCIAFHPTFVGTFATGGCDGTVVTWDGLNKKKLTTLPSFATSIAAMAFNHDGTELAIAASYTYEDGEREHPRDEIFVRPMLDQECQPKESSK